MSEAPNPLENLDDELIRLLSEYDDRLLADAEPETAVSESVPADREHQFLRARALIRDLVSLGAGCSENTPPTRAATAPSDSATLFSSEIPDRIARFEIRRVLGYGGFGIVYLAYDPNLRREVALKIPLMGGLATPEMRERFLREARAAAGLDHANIVPVYEADQDGSVCYIASAFCRGPNLSEWLSERRDAVPARLSASVVATLADAVEHAHRRGVLHRDLKPSNILLDAIENPAARPSDEITDLNFIPKLTDFGLAKVQEEGFEETRSGVLVGTASYMAPEQAAGRKQIGPAADVYALGTILYELLTGRPPFQGETQLETLNQVQSHEPVLLRRLRPELPRDLETICLKCLEKDPSRRYPSAEELGNDLHRYLDGQPIEARPTSAASRIGRWSRRNPSLATLIVSVATLLVVVAVGSMIAAHRLHVAGVRALRNSFEAYVSEARAHRMSGKSGQRFDSLSSIAKAAGLASQLELEDRDLLRLRNEAIAAMALPDLSVDRKGPEAPDGKRTLAFDSRLDLYARPGGGAEIVLGRLDDGAEVARLKGVAGEVTQLRISPDGRWLGALCEVDDRRSVQAWDLSHPESPAKSVIDLPSARYLDFSPDGRFLAIVHGEDTVEVSLYVADSMEPAQRFAVDFEARGCRFSPDAKHLALWGVEQVQVLDVDGSRVVQRLAHPPDTSVQSVAWSSDGRLLASAVSDHFAYVWDTTESGESPQAVCRGHQAWVTDVAFHADNELLVTSALDDETIRLWDPRNGRALTSSRGRLVQSAHDRPWLAGVIGSSIVRWEVADASEVSTLFDRRVSRAFNADINADGRLLAAGWHQGVYLWDLGAGKQVGFIECGEVCEAIFDVRSANLITVGDKGLLCWPVRRLREKSGVQVGPPERLEGPLACNAHHHQSSVGGSLVAIASWNHACVLDRTGQAAEAKTARVLKHDTMQMVAVSPEGRWIATAGRAPGVRVWEAESAKPLRDLLSDAKSATVAFSPNRKWLVAATDRALCFYQTGTWQLSHRCSWEDSPATPGKIAFSADGRLVAINRSDSQIKLLEIATGRELATVPAFHPEGWLRLSPDGSQLVCLGEGLAIRVWDFRMIRTQLAELGLDWDPPFTAPPLSDPHSGSTPVTVSLTSADRPAR